MKALSFSKLKKVWGVILLWPGVFLYYAHWDYVPWKFALFQVTVVLGCAGLVWSIFCSLYKDLERGSVFYAAFSSITYLFIFLFHDIFVDYLDFSHSVRDVILYACATGMGVGGGMIAVSWKSFDYIGRFFHFFSIVIFLLNGMVWPLYRLAKHSRQEKKSFISSSPCLSRSVYFIVLDEHPSPTVLSKVLPKSDTFLFSISQEGFLYNDSIWATYASTLHTLAKVYRVPYGIEKGTIIDFGFLRNAHLLLDAQKKGYELRGLLPYYGPLQQLPIQWEGNWLFSSAFGHFPWIRPIGRWIKHLYDKAFVAGMKKISRTLPEKPTIYHLHVFLTHTPYSTGIEGKWQPLDGFSLEEQIRNTISYTHKEVLDFINNLLASYRKAHRPEPIIFIFSDHGWHKGEPEQLGIADPALRRHLKHQAFMAAYLPGWDRTRARAAVEAVQDYEGLSRLLQEALGMESCVGGS